MSVDKKNIIKKHQSHKKDTGSTAVQVAVLTERIKNLTEHLKTHKKDAHSRKGLFGLVGKRTRLLRYMKMNQKDEYQALVTDLGIRQKAS